MSDTTNETDQAHGAHEAHERAQEAKPEAPRADCAVDAEGRVTVELSLPGSTGGEQLLLRLRPKKGEPETTTHTLALTPVPGAPGRLRAVLDPEPVLAEGRWDVYALAAPDAERRRLRPGLRDLRVLAPGQRPAGAPLPLPLAVRVPYATKDRWLAIRAWLRPAHAEAADIRVADGAMTVHGRLLGTTLGDGAAALLRCRGKGGPVVETPLRAEGPDTFSFTARYDFPAPPGPDPAFWDVFVRPRPKAPRVRVARLLDDVADKKQIFVYPATTVGAASVRPYYTVDNDLAVEVAPAG
ncbi:transferase [Streptomyces sp. NBC_01803]|uniref:transferase n=1 Tax=Streptomyces sp. NBC_01803 TaxID=2975946 RepID=UPI002DD8BA7B|nr:transferase [Streptomyces sp. NBC_01803]WSA44277.1 transferase [Streptomyces sp. NBC_01803]